MDAKGEPTIEDHIATVQERIDKHRDDIAETVEALSYKTDVGARGSEALVEAGRTAKAVAERVTEDAVIRTIDTTARASEALAEPTNRSRLLLFGAILAVVTLGFVLLRRKRNSDDA